MLWESVICVEKLHFVIRGIKGSPLRTKAFEVIATAPFNLLITDLSFTLALLFLLHALELN